MKLPSFSDLEEDQLSVYLQPANESILVIGPPGSGKTSIAIWRARLLAGQEVNNRVAFVARNRLLAAVAGQLAREQQGENITVVTMFTLVASDYYRRFNRMIPQWAPFIYRWDEIFEQYDQAGTAPAYDHLIIDEGQNLPPEFFQWAVRFGARVVSVFADENQSTLETTSTMRDFRAAGFDKVYPLLFNHRNTKEIADLTEQFHLNRILPPATVKRGGGFDRPRLTSFTTWDALANAVSTRYRNKAGSIGVIVFRKDDVNQVARLLRARLGDVRVDSYTSDSDQGHERAIRMRENGVTVISSESAIGLEFDTVYLQDLDRSLPLTSEIDHRRMYMLCARARDMLVLVNGPAQLSAEQVSALPPKAFLER